jgi:hypothetical protein
MAEDLNDAPARLTDLLSSTRRLALVGLAKNTGKTETLAAVLRELAERDRRVGVTSIGRDGEAHDVIDARIDKPRIVLQAGSLVASTDALVRASGLAHEQLARTGIRTPLGEVVIARLAQRGAVEVAGPSAAEDLRKVSDSMIELGAEIVLIDGSIDRRAASSPAVADGLVIATGAVLSEDIEEVVAATKDAVDLVNLPAAASPRMDGSTGAGEEPLALERGLVLGAEPAEIAALLREHPHASTFRIDGALSERFLEGLLAARNDPSPPTRRELRILVGDPTKVFLTRRGPDWYRRQGLAIEVSQTIRLQAITVNPVAPQSHRFDSQQLRELIEAAVADVPVFDVLDPSYLALAK